VLNLFTALSWPGNVRQLINVLRNVVVLNDGPVVERHMLPPDLEPVASQRAAPTAAPAGSAMELLAGKTLAQVERLVIEEAIKRHAGSVPKAARELGVSPSTLYRKQESWDKTDT